MPSATPGSLVTSTTRDSSASQASTASDSSVTRATRSRRGVATVAAFALAGLAAGCSGEDNSLGEQEAPEIAEAARTAMAEVSSVRMQGEGDMEGSTMAVDIALDTDGQCEGTLTMDGAEAQILSTGENGYFRAGEDFWNSMAEGQGAMVAEFIGDKWAKLPTESSPVGGMCDLSEFTEALGENDDEAEITKGEVTEIEGTEAVELTRNDGGTDMSVWVSTSEPHHILRATGSDNSDEPLDVTFTDYDAELDVQEPDSADVIDLSNF